MSSQVTLQLTYLLLQMFPTLIYSRTTKSIAGLSGAPASPVQFLKMAVRKSSIVSFVFKSVAFNSLARLQAWSISKHRFSSESSRSSGVVMDRGLRRI